MPMNETMPELKWSTPRVRRKVLYITLLLALFCYAFFNWVLWPVKVVGDSMFPTYHDGARHFVNKLAYLSAKPQRGDVVALRTLDDDIYIKRIIGLPGERIDFELGRVLINGKRLDEPYTRAFVPWDMDPVTLPPDTYYMMGDNRATSVLGQVALERIIGKVTF